jgi:hypothetical protein
MLSIWRRPFFSSIRQLPFFDANGADQGHQPHGHYKNHSQQTDAGFHAAVALPSTTARLRKKENGMTMTLLDN